MLNLSTSFKYPKPKFNTSLQHFSFFSIFFDANDGNVRSQTHFDDQMAEKFKNCK